ncbi:magnesium transporter CorA family protein [Taibaiella soli]|uniref:Magnesium transporter CorA family protein n=1 Tax=Taibaiella soli TaxID=1649169 RepID=A0A2W2ANN2_9BACT|nr:magnesium transporter CorA family protein [Taibaiella soli]PZF73970.1 magnesium transporter CorA family protein [Taibaiella soli]
MVQFYKNINRQTLEIEQPQGANWINVTPPFQQSEIDNLSESLSIPRDFLTDTLDIEERARYEVEDGVKLVILKTPVENKSLNESDAYYITIPIAIIVTEHNQVITVNSFENVAIRRFLTTFAKRHPERPNMMVLKIFEKVVMDFMEVLKEINHRRNILEQKLYDANRNEELLYLMRVQKSLVYFITALRSDELLLMKMERTNFLNFDEEEREFLADLIVEFSQALEMADTYTNILSSTMDAFASIINNNMNIVMKRLTAITIILSVPALVAAFFGMNVHFPTENTIVGFYAAIIISIIISVIMSLYFNKKRWF